MKFVHEDVVVAGHAGEILAFLELLAFVEVGDVLLIFQGERRALDQVPGRVTPEAVERVVDLAVPRPGLLFARAIDGAAQDPEIR